MGSLHLNALYGEVQTLSQSILLSLQAQKSGWPRQWADRQHWAGQPGATGLSALQCFVRGSEELRQSCEEGGAGQEAPRRVSLLARARDKERGAQQQPGRSQVM